LTNIVLVECLDCFISVSDVFSRLNERGKVFCSGLTDAELEMSKKLGDEIFRTVSRSTSTLLDFAKRTDGVLKASEQIFETSVFIGVSIAALRSYFELKPHNLNFVETIQKNKSFNSSQKAIILGATLKAISIGATSSSEASGVVLRERALADLSHTFTSRYGMDINGVSTDVCKALLSTTEEIDTFNNDAEKDLKKLSIKLDLEVDVDDKKAVTPTVSELIELDQQKITKFEAS
jgi:hypothetical protein